MCENARRMNDRVSARTGQSIEGVRIDIWLWAARFFKTRALAKQALVAGRVEIAGATCKPSRQVRIGDTLTIVRGEERFEITVAGLSEQRGPAAVAQALYEESDVSRERREAAAVQRRAERAGFRPPESKPDKRARRLIRALGDLDAL